MLDYFRPVPEGSNNDLSQGSTTAPKPGPKRSRRGPKLSNLPLETIRVLSNESRYYPFLGSNWSSIRREEKKSNAHISLGLTMIPSIFRYAEFITHRPATKYIFLPKAIFFGARERPDEYSLLESVLGLRSVTRTLDKISTAAPLLRRSKQRLRQIRKWRMI